MNIKIRYGHLEGTVQMISSKSNVHRLLLAAALAEKPTEIKLKGHSDDIEATGACLMSLGSNVEPSKDGVCITPIIQNTNEVAVLDCGESGSTLRFLLPIAGALGRNVLVEGKGRLPQRPISILTEQMSHHGCFFNGTHLPLELSGQLTGGRYELPGNVSSQFITGLLFALPLLEKDSEIILTTKPESMGYISMTLQTLSHFGIEIEKHENGYKIKGRQKYHTPGFIQAEGDWSNAAFWLSAGAVCGEITCKELQTDSPQGDKAILDVLKQFGAVVEVKEDYVKVRAGNLHGCHIDASQIPDLVPILSIVAAVAKGDTLIYNAGRLRIKESDRLAAMADCLTRLGFSVEEGEDSLLIHGGKRNIPQDPVRIDSFHDHRIAMSAAIAGSILGQELIIEGAECVTKSYPGFFADFIRLGGGADVL